MWWKKCLRHWACTYVQKRQLFRQRQLNHKGKGDSDYGTRSHIAEPYSCLQVWVSLIKGSEPFCRPFPHGKMTQIWLFESRSLLSIYTSFLTIDNINFIFLCCSVYCILYNRLLQYNTTKCLPNIHKEGGSRGGGIIWLVNVYIRLYKWTSRVYLTYQKKIDK